MESVRGATTLPSTRSATFENVEASGSATLSKSAGQPNDAFVAVAFARYASRATRLR